MPTVVNIRFQTRSLPPPYSYHYALELRLEDQAVRARLDWTYTDRDELTEGDIEEEGFSANDDFFWEGTLPLVWKAPLHDLLQNPRWLPETATDDSALRVTVTDSTKETTGGSPYDHAEWEYFLQETVQAIYEAAQRERPLRLAYLAIQEDGKPVELRWEASFLHRSFTMMRVSDDQSPKQPVPWQQLRSLLQAWYVPDYHPEKAEPSFPQQAGDYVDPGDGHWYQLGKAATNPGKPDAIGHLRSAVRSFGIFPERNS
ncbi:MAG: hypothetical protein WA960_09905 [Tunicatimonas sp.]